MNRKKRFRRVAALLCVLLTLGAASCAKKTTLQKYTSSSFDYFDTVTLVTGYAESKEAFDAVSTLIFSELEQYHKLYTVYDRFEGVNNLCVVNDLSDGAHREIAVDERILDLLTFCKAVYVQTDGKTNVAMGSVLSVWHRYREAGLEDPANAALPPAEELAAASQHTNIDDLVINREKKTVYLRDPQMLLDVGAVAKGYAVERIAQMLEERGVAGYCLNVGGNVCTLGTRGDGTDWRVGVENPNGEEPEYLAILGLTDCSLVVSGSYQRYYTVNGKTYHHIIDPATLQPASYYLSVAVVTPDSAMGDALSTALFCMPYEEASALVEALPDTEALFVFADGSQRATAGFDARKAEA